MHMYTCAYMSNYMLVILLNKFNINEYEYLKIFLFRVVVSGVVDLSIYFSNYIYLPTFKII
jgi:hypothetical protein